MTDLERLKTWMVEHDIKASEMANEMRLTRSAVHLILAGKRNIGDGFKWKFREAYGYIAAHFIFSDEDKNRSPHPLSEPVAHPEQYAAHRAVAVAILRGELLPAKAYKCHGCNKQAQQYHHESYHSNDHLCVVPLCQTCHRRHHSGHTHLTFGGIPTPVPNLVK